MRCHFTKLVFAVIMSCGVITTTNRAWSQSPHYPSRAIRAFVAASPGSSTDILARTVGAKVADIVKQPFVVENRPGAGGTLGWREVINSSPDAHAVVGAAGTFMWAKVVQPNLDFDPVTDLEPVSQVTKTGLVVSVNLALPIRSIKELIAYAKKHPGKLNGGVTNGAVTHLSLAYFQSAAGVQITIVPYKAAAAIAADLLAGRLDLMFGDILSNSGRIKAGKVRALGITTSQHNPIIPDVPPIGLTIPGYEVNGFFGFFTTKGSPVSSINTLGRAISSAVQSPEVHDMIARQGSIPLGSTPQQFKETINRSAPIYQKIAKDANMSVQ